MNPGDVGALRVIIGIAFIVSGISEFLLAKYLIVVPVLKSGGELAGPVGFFRYPTYTVCFAQIIIGLLIVDTFRSS